MKALPILLLLLASALGCSRQRPPEDSGGDAPAEPATHASEHGGGQAGHEGAPEAAATQHEAPPVPEGYSEVVVSPERRQLIGVKLARVERAELVGAVRAPAVISTDETKEAHVHTKLVGWVQDLYVNAVGQTVNQGDPLYSLYSQELFATQQEYLRALKTNPELAKTARRRLELWDVPEGEIRRIERSGPLKSIAFLSPIRGVVLEKNVLRGHFIESGMMLYRIADLSQVWALADVYEFEIDRLDRQGQASVLVQGLEDALPSKVDYVYPTVDPTTRTVRVRLVLPNRDGRLRPGSFATAELPTAPTSALWIPNEAVIDTGVRRVAYVSSGEGRFRPVEVRLGRRVDDRVEVREGLDEGMEVVSGAQFLIDSESRLRGVSGGGAKHGGGH